MAESGSFLGSLAKLVLAIFLSALVISVCSKGQSPAPATSPPSVEAPPAPAPKSSSTSEQAEARQAFAEQMEGKYLQKGLDVHVSVHGKKKTTLQLKYVLMSRPTVYQLVNDESFETMVRGMGFKKVVFTDGYDSTWTYTY